MTKSSKLTRRLILIGMMAAIIFVGNYFSLPIVLSIGTSRIHLATICMLLAGFVLGGVDGGIAAGIGSMFYDFTNPLFVTSAPTTLIFRFLMIFVCGTIAYANGKQGRNVKYNIVGAIAGSLLYVLLYMAKTYVSTAILLGTEVQTALITMAQKGVISLINATIGVVIAVPLGFAVHKALDSSFRTK